METVSRVADVPQVDVTIPISLLSTLTYPVPYEAVLHAIMSFSVNLSNLTGFALIESPGLIMSVTRKSLMSEIWGWPILLFFCLFVPIYNRAILVSHNEVNSWVWTKETSNHPSFHTNKCHYHFCSNRIICRCCATPWWSCVGWRQRDLSCEYFTILTWWLVWFVRHKQKIR